MASQNEQPTFPLKIMVDKERNKVVVAEATRDFVDTLFSFMTLPLGTIICLVGNKEISEPAIIGSINNLYQSVEDLCTSNMWNDVCKQMLLHPKNPCEALCLKLLLNVDDTEPTKLFVCDTCNNLSTFANLSCTCGKLVTKLPQNLDCQGNAGAKGGVFVIETRSMFLVSDDLKIVPTSSLTSLQLLAKLGYKDLTQIEEVTQNFVLPKMLKLLKHALTSNEPLTNTILDQSNKKENAPNQPTYVAGSRSASVDPKVEVKVVRCKSKNKIIFAEAMEDFVDFMISFLTMPLGSIVKLLGGNTSVGCVDNLYKSVASLDSKWCTSSHSVLLNPGVAPQFGFPNQPLSIPHLEPPSYFYGTGLIVTRTYYSNYHKTTLEDRREEKIEGGVISKNYSDSIANVRRLTTLEPRSPSRSKEDLVGFVKRPSLYAIEDDLKVRPMSAIYCLSILKEFSIPLDDLEVRVVGIGEAEALSLLGASLTSKTTLTSGLEEFLKDKVREMKEASSSKVSIEGASTSELDESSFLLTAIGGKNKKMTIETSSSEAFLQPNFNGFALQAENQELKKTVADQGAEIKNLKDSMAYLTALVSKLFSQVQGT